MKRLFIRYLLAVIWRMAERRNERVLLDVGQDGPIATVELSGCVPFGFHGNWVPSS
jgi:carotenoid cleavage dioxygenase-like enzyme